MLGYSWQLSFGLFAFRKTLHRLARPMYLGVSATAERPRDADAEAVGQRPVDTKIGGQRLEGQESES